MAISSSSSSSSVSSTRSWTSASSLSLSSLSTSSSESSNLARYWVAAAPGNWNTAANWAYYSGGPGGAAVPTSADDVYFDGNGVGNCTVDVSASCKDFNLVSGYTGTITQTSALRVYGNASFAAACTYACGANTLTIDGNLTSTAGTFTCSTGTVTIAGNVSLAWSGFTSGATNGKWYFTGTGKTFANSSSGNSPRYVEFSSGASYTASGTIYTRALADSPTWDIYGTLSVGGTLYSYAALRVYSTGTASGAGTIVSRGVSVAIDAGGTCSVRVTYYESGTFRGTISNQLSIYITSAARVTVTFVGDSVVTGNLVTSTASTGIPEFSLSAFNPNLELRGSVTTIAATQWTKGTGTIYLTGASSQTVDFNDLAIEDLDINKTAGTVTFAGGFTTDSLYCRSGAYAIDWGDLSSTFNIVGDATFTGAITSIDTGAGNSFYVGGNWSSSGLSSAVWTDAALSSYLYMTGTSKTYRAGYNKSVSSLVIQAGATITNDSSGAGHYGARLYVYGSYTANYTQSVTTVVVYATGTFTGAGDIYASGASFQNSAGGTWSIATTQCGAYSPGSWSAGSVFSGTTFTWLNNGAVGNRTPVSATFDCNVAISCTSGTLGVNDAVNNPNWVFKKNVTISQSGTGTLTWSKGSGTITLSGSGNQTVDFDARTIEDLVINNTGGLITFSDGFTTDSLTGIDGDVDLNGKTITVAGNVVFDKSTGFRLWNGTDADQSSAVIDYDGDLTLTGVLGSLLAIVELDFVNTVADTPTATYVSVQGSSRTGGGPDIDASDGTSTDGGSNVGWLFGDVSSSSSLGVTSSSSSSASSSLGLTSSSSSSVSSSSVSSSSVSSSSESSISSSSSSLGVSSSSSSLSSQTSEYDFWYVDPDAVGSNDGTSWANAWTSVATAVASTAIGPGDRILCRGAESLATALTLDTTTIDGVAWRPISLVGCNAAGIEDGTRYVLTFANETHGFYNDGALYWNVENFEFYSTCATGTNHGIYRGTTSTGTYLINVISHGWTGHGIYDTGGQLTMLGVATYDNAGDGFYSADDSVITAFGFRASGNAGHGLELVTQNVGLQLIGGLLYGNGGDGLVLAYTGQVFCSVIADNTGDGISLEVDAGAFNLIGLRITGNGGWGVGAVTETTPNSSGRGRNNVFACYLGNNASGDLDAGNDVLDVAGFPSFTVTGGTDTDDGYVDSASEDYELAASATLRNAPLWPLD